MSDEEVWLTAQRQNLRFWGRVPQEMAAAVRDFYEELRPHWASTRSQDSDVARLWQGLVVTERVRRFKDELSVALGDAVRRSRAERRPRHPSTSTSWSRFDEITADFEADMVAGRADDVVGRAHLLDDIAKYWVRMGCLTLAAQGHEDLARALQRRYRYSKGSGPTNWLAMFGDEIEDEAQNSALLCLWYRSAPEPPGSAARAVQSPSPWGPREALDVSASLTPRWKGNVEAAEVDGGVLVVGLFRALLVSLLWPRVMPDPIRVHHGLD